MVTDEHARAAGDVGERGEVEHLIASTVESRGRVDSVIHSAAVLAYGKLHQQVGVARIGSHPADRDPPYAPGNVFEPQPSREAVHGRWPHIWG